MNIFATAKAFEPIKFFIKFFECFFGNFFKTIFNFLLLLDNNFYCIQRSFHKGLNPCNGNSNDDDDNDDIRAQGQDQTKIRLTMKKHGT